MADAPNDAANPGSEPASQPTPEAKPAGADPKTSSEPARDPAHEQAPKREAAVETKIPDSLDPKLRIEIDGGPDQGVSLGELVANYQKTGTLSEKAVQVAQLVEGADKKDPQSILGLFGLNPDGTDPNATPEAAPAAAGTVAGADNEKIAALEQRVNEQAAFIGEIAGVRDQVQLRSAITEHAEKLPMLAADPKRGAEDVQRQLVEIDSIMRTQNPAYDPSKLSRPEQTQRFEAAFVRAENGLLDVVKRYNPDFKPATKAAGDPGGQAGTQKPAGAKDDQGTAEERSGPPDSMPATVDFVNGRFVDHKGEPVRQSATGEVVPQEIPNPGAASAAAVPPTGPAANQGGVTFREQRKAAINARRQELQAGEQ